MDSAQFKRLIIVLKILLQLYQTVDLNSGRGLKSVRFIEV